MLTREQVLQELRRARMVAVVRTKTAEQAAAAARALIAGGAPVVEITLTVPEAVDVIRELAAAYGSRVLIGAGTVMTAAEARQVIDAGARFAVSPICELSLITACHAADVVAVPSGLTPTEIVAAVRAGADLVKVYPLSAVGGASYLRIISEPLPGVPILAAGGITFENGHELLAAGAQVLSFTSDLLKRELVETEDWAAISERTRRYVQSFAGTQGHG